LSTAGAAIELRSVSKRYGKRDAATTAVSEVTLNIAPGEFVSLVGPSGCGKTTLLSMIAGFQAPSAGQVSVAGATVSGASPDRGMVFQQHRLFPWLSVRKNVEFGPRHLGFSKDEAREIAMANLELVGLASLATKASYELSGGQKQRVAIARTLAGNPRVLLMDEPFSALDAFTRETLQEELLSLWRKLGITVVFVTHSIDEAVFLSDRVVLLGSNPGRILAEETAGFSRGDNFLHSRKLAAFGELRDRLTTQLRATSL
jgi:ABC-type nitrate/sulfonate/bicarbonate transport system ATPase subunit